MEKLKEIYDTMDATTKKLEAILEKKSDKVIILTDKQFNNMYEAVIQYQLRNQTIAKGCTTNGTAFKEALRHIENAKELRTILNEA